MFFLSTIKKVSLKLRVYFKRRAIPYANKFKNKLEPFADSFNFTFFKISNNFISKNPSHIIGLLWQFCLISRNIFFSKEFKKIEKKNFYFTIFEAFCAR